MSDEQTFRLSIRLGNDAMQTADDVCEVLMKVYSQVNTCGLQDKAQSIFDTNGNRVGQWKVES